MIDKAELRKHFKKIRCDMKPDERRKADLAVTESFLESDAYHNCSRLLAYVSSDIEVDTHFILERAFDEKEVLCPRCEKSGNIMFFYKVYSFDDLEKGHFGILEPKDSCVIVNEFCKDDLCIVPALSYDKAGFRLGFGKGYYDRFLSKFAGKTIGLCYENCLSEALPCDRFDRSVENVITEKDIYLYGRMD